MTPHRSPRPSAVAARRVVPARSRVPTLREERRLLRSGHLYVAGMDEVGRGALAGPVTVGVVVVDAAARSAPTGVRDSKLLTPAAREALVPKLRRWAVGYAVGHAEPEEIDSYGIIAALRLAARRALSQLGTPPSCVLLDGSHDWLTPPGEPAGLFDLDVPGRRPAPCIELSLEPAVTTLVKADMRCAAVAAASVLAKVERDAIMVERSAAFPDYGWRENKGYSAPEHATALRRLGPCAQHRRTWSLPVAEQLAAEQLAGEGLDPRAPDSDDLDLVGEGPTDEEFDVGLFGTGLFDGGLFDRGLGGGLPGGEPSGAGEAVAGDLDDGLPDCGEAAGEEAAGAMPDADEPAAEEAGGEEVQVLLDLVEAGGGGCRGEGSGRRADDAAHLRHDGSVAR
jgi:ribonuclease HII